VTAGKSRTSQLHRSGRLIAIATLLVSLGLIANPSSAVADTVAVEAIAPSGLEWLDTLNEYRLAAGVDPVVAEPSWTSSIASHLDYLARTPAPLRTGPYATVHDQNPASPYFSTSGREAAISSAFGFGWSEREAIDHFFSAPFHAITLLRPGLRRSSFAMRDTTVGLDVIRGWVADRSTTPVLFPGPGSSVGINGFDGDESPDPLESCPGFTAPSGLPIVALLPNAPGAVRASVKGPSGPMAAGDVCVITPTTVRSSDPVYGATAKATLESDHAVIIVPRRPLVSGSYSVDLIADGPSSISWTFRVAAPRLGTTVGPVTTGRPLRIHVGAANRTVIGTVTVDRPAADGFATVYPCNSSIPLASNINFRRGVAIAASFLANTDEYGNLCVATSTATHVIVDRVAETSEPDAFRAVRDVDTRTGRAMAAGETRVFRLRAPADTTVFGTATITGATSEGFLSVGPCTPALRSTSTLNFSRGVDIANLFVARTGSDGSVCVHTSAAAHVVLDRTAESSVFPIMSSTRLLDTRPTTAIVAGEIRRVSTGHPSAVVIGSVVGVESNGPGYVTVYACDSGRPGTSNLNLVPGGTIANAFVSEVGPSGDLCITSSVTTHLLLDLFAVTDRVSNVHAPIRDADTRTGPHTYEPFPF
jgi:hypothetical protein